MRSLLHITAAAAAILIAKLGTTGVLAHPGCFTPDETPTLTVELEFCELEEDGACCTPTQEADAIALFDLAVASAPGQSLSAECASYYKQVRAENYIRTSLQNSTFPACCVSRLFI